MIEYKSELFRQALQYISARSLQEIFCGKWQKLSCSCEDYGQAERDQFGGYGSRNKGHEVSVPERQEMWIYTKACLR